MILKSGQRVYHQVLRIPEGVEGEFSIVHDRHPAGHEFPLTSLRTRMMGGHAGQPVTFDHETQWHLLCERGGVWMSDHPIEQGQHDYELRPIHNGTVLVGGLGLGYAATVLARQPKVTRVVVVEKAPEVIKLVAPHLCADDARAHAKLDVVEADLFDYLGMVPPNTFTWAFYDIWRSDGEATFFNVVIPLLKLSAARVRNLPICWNESVMRGQLYNDLAGARLHFATLSEATAIKAFGDKERCWQTLDELAEYNGDLWWDWSVPFFQWVKRRQDRGSMAVVNQSVDPDVDQMARAYAAQYGRPSFPKYWQTIAGIPVVEPVFRPERSGH